MFDFVEDRSRRRADHGAASPDEGVRLAQEAGLDAEPVAVEAGGPVWERRSSGSPSSTSAATIVMGSRGLTGLRAMLLGSVSSAVVHHADRPTLVIPRPVVRT